MKNHMTRFLSRVLVLLMMLQLVSVGPVFATSASAENDEAEQEEILSNDAEDDVEEAAPAEEPAEEEPVEEAPVENEEPVEEPVFDVEASADEIALKDGAAIIKTSDLNEVKAILAKALIANYDPEKDYSELEWEYECKGTGGFGKLSNTDWGSIAGFTSTKLRVNYTHPALWDNADGTYRVRLADNTDVVVGLQWQKRKKSRRIPALPSWRILRSSFSITTTAPSTTTKSARWCLSRSLPPLRKASPLMICMLHIMRHPVLLD